MLVEILTKELKVEEVTTDSWRLLEPLVFKVTCEEQEEPFIFAVPGGYITDFESVPKFLILSYALIKGRFKRAATGHDYLIDWIQKEVASPLEPRSMPFKPSRSWIDSFFLAAMKAESTLPNRDKQPIRDGIARNTAYLGVSAYTLFSGE